MCDVSNNSMPELIPAILVKDADAFRARLRSMEGSVATVQLDCMDGHFVDNRSWYAAEPLDTGLEIELHLMVGNPLAVIEDWKRVRQVTRALWHVEIPTDHGKVVARCRELGWQCGLALSPETPVERLAQFANDIDEALVLGVHPGWSGQVLIPSTLDKLDQIKARWPGLITGFDGGVTPANLPDILRHPLDRLNAASAIFDAPDPAAAVRAILKSV